MKVCQMIFFSLILLAVLSQEQNIEVTQNPSEERKLSSVFEIPMVIEDSPRSNSQNVSFLSDLPQLKMEPIFPRQNNAFEMIRNLENELQGVFQKGNKPHMKMVTFETAVNSEQKGNQQEPKITGYTSGMNLEKLPEGQVIIEQFHQPINQKRNQNLLKRKLWNQSQFLNGKLKIEPVINLNTLGKEEQGSNINFGSMLMKQILKDQKSVKRPEMIELDPVQVLRRPQQRVQTGRLDVDGPARQQSPANDFIASLLGGMNFSRKPAINRPFFPTRIKPIAAFSNLANVMVLPKKQQGLESEFGKDFLEQIMGGVNSQRKSPSIDLQEDTSNPLSFILGMAGNQGKSMPIRKRRTARVPLKGRVIKRSKQSKLNNFLSQILGGEAPKETVKNANQNLNLHPRINSMGLQSGVDQLLSLLETSQQDHLTQPINEPEEENPMLGLLGGDVLDGEESNGGLLKALMGNGAPQINKKVMKHHKRVTRTSIQKLQRPSFNFKLPTLQELHRPLLNFKLPIVNAGDCKRTLPSLRNKEHIPLMNDFYRLKDIRKQMTPVTYPPLGHRKATLDKIRANVFVYPKNGLKRQRMHRKSGKYLPLKSAQNHIISADLLPFSQLLVPHHVRPLRRHRRASKKGLASSSHTQIHILTHKKSHRRTNSRRHRSHRLRKNQRTMKNKMDDFISGLIAKNDNGKFVI